MWPKSSERETEFGDVDRISSTLFFFFKLGSIPIVGRELHALSTEPARHSYSFLGRSVLFLRLDQNLDFSLL